MWCPAEVRRAQTTRRSKAQLDASMYDPAWVASLNYSKQVPSYGASNPY
jgi:hypothetical protein